MKRNIIINDSRTAMVITNQLDSGVKLVATDSTIGEEIYVFDTFLHVCYSFRNAVSGCEVIEESVPLMQFRSFAKCIGNNPKEIYKALITSL